MEDVAGSDRWFLCYSAGTCAVCGGLCQWRWNGYALPSKTLDHIEKSSERHGTTREHIILNPKDQRISIETLCEPIFYIGQHTFSNDRNIGHGT
jgi:hypothetical protein